MMRRTILGLFVEPATGGIEPTQRGSTAVSVEDVQETLGGRSVYHGHAAYRGSRDTPTPVVTETDDGDIEITEGTERVHDPKLVEYFAVPDANPGFVAFDSSDMRFAKNALSAVSGGWIEPAVYDLEAVTDHLTDEHDAGWWQVGWNDDEEAGVYYPDSDPGTATDHITRQGLGKPKSQVGFRYFDGTTSIRGTIAGSGYCNLYSPDAWGFEQMAAWLGNEVLQYSGIKDVGSAQDIANGNADFDFGCDDCGRASEDLREFPGGDVLCPVCKDKRDEDDAATDDAQTTLGESTTDDADEEEPYAQLDSVNVTDGGQ